MNITELLKDIKKTKTINTMHLCKIGAVGIRAEDKVNPPQVIVDSLFKSPYVYSEEKPMLDKSHIAASTTNKAAILFEFDSYAVKIQIPKSNQKYNNFLSIPSGFETFNALVSGTIFLCYLEVERPRSEYIAHEFREIFTSSIQEADGVEPVNVGPSPIHPDIDVVRTRLEGGDSQWIVHESEGKNILLELVNNDEDAIEEDLKRLFRKVVHPICDFYRSQLYRNENYEAEEKVHNDFNALISHYEEENKKKILKRWISGFKGTLHELTCSFYTSLAKYEFEEAHYLAHSELAVKNIRENIYLSSLLEYFSERVKVRNNIPASYSTSVSNLNSSYNTMSGAKIAALASLVGAIIGALIASLVPLYLPLNHGSSVEDSARIEYNQDLNEIKSNKSKQQGPSAGTH